MNENRRTVNTVFIIIALTLLAKLLGFFRDALLGSKVGATFESDAYLMALNSTTILFLSVGSAISTSAIPLIVKKFKSYGKASVFEFLNKIINSILLITGLFVILGIIFSPKILSITAKGFYGEKRTLVIALTRIMFPSFIFINITYLYVAFLQSFNRFIIPALISFPFNALLIFYLLFALNKYGIIGLAYATLLGWFLQLIIQLPFIFKEGYRYKFSLGLNDDDIKRFFISLLPIIFAASINQLNFLVDNMYASTLEHGKVAAMYYANMLYQAIVTTTVYGISAVIFPKFSQNLSYNDLSSFKNMVLTVIKTVIYLLMPITVGLIVLNKPLISLVFERGQFDNITTINTSLALTNFSIGMIGFGIIDIINKAFYTLNNTKIPLNVGILIVTLNYILNKILLEYLGFKGLALATSISLIFGAILLIHLFAKRVGKLEMRSLLNTIFKVGISSAVMGISISYLKKYLSFVLIKNTLLVKFIMLVAPVTLGVLVFAILTFILKEKSSIFIFENYIKPKFNFRNR